MPAFNQSSSGLPGLLLVISVIVMYALSATPAISNDNTEKSQLLALQTRVQLLEREIQALKSSTNHTSHDDSRTGADGNKVLILAQDRLTLKAGRSTLQLSKDGTITLTGIRFDINTTQDVDLRGSKISDN